MVIGDVVFVTIVEKLEAGVVFVEMNTELVDSVTLMVVGRDLVVSATDLVIWTNFVGLGLVEEKLGISIGLSSVVADKLVSPTVITVVVSLVVSASGLGGGQFCSRNHRF